MYLENQSPGAGGEIQLTDAIAELNKHEAVYAYDFEGTRYDVGEKMGFIQTTIEFALQRDDLKARLTRLPFKCNGTRISQESRIIEAGDKDGKLNTVLCNSRLPFKAFHLPYMKWFKEQGWEVHVAASGEMELPYVDRKYTIPIQRSPISYEEHRGLSGIKRNY